jgi:hypothetical protein
MEGVRMACIRSTRRPSSAVRGGAVVAIFSAVLFALIWLGSGARPAVQAAEKPAAEAAAPEQPVAEKPAAEKRFPNIVGPVVADVAYIPSDASLALIIRPAELAASPIARRVAAAFDELLAPENLGLKVDQIELFKVVIAGGLNQPGNDATCGYMILRSRAAHDWKKVFQNLLGAGKVEELDGQKYFQAGDTNDFGAYWFPDERTVVFGSPSGIARTFSTPDANDRAPWAEKWARAVKSPVAGLLQMNVLEMFHGGPAVDDCGQPVENDMAPLSADGEYGILTGDITADGFAVSAAVQCRSAEGAARVAPALAKALTKLANQIATPSAIDAVGEDTEKGDEDDNGRLAEQIARLAENTKVTTQDSMVHVRAVVTPTMLDVFAASAQSAARSQSLRQASQKKIEQIAAAMNKYHDDNGHFPPAVVMGPDGKTPHSWRVEILPYHDGGKDLHARYRMNEAWDSDHNQQVMKDGIDLFAAPSEIDNDESSTCGYFVVAGTGTLFDGETRPTRESVTDGAAATIMVVEARRSIPWTKPEDIAYDPDAALPQLGGNLHSVFLVARVDGSAQFMAGNSDETLLRSLLTKAAGDNAEKNAP